jgi:hypothetical protein
MSCHSESTRPRLIWLGGDPRPPPRQACDDVVVGDDPGADRGRRGLPLSESGVALAQLWILSVRNGAFSALPPADFREHLFLS